MKVEFNTKTEKIKSGTLVKYKSEIVKYKSESGDSTFVSYAIYLTDMDEEEPILYDLHDDCYYTDVDMYDIEPVICNVKLVVE